MFVKNEGNHIRSVGGKQIHPGETREVPDGTPLGKDLRDVNASAPASAPASKQYAKNVKVLAIDISMMEDVEALKAILAEDDRKTVIAAVEARIKELKG